MLNSWWKSVSQQLQLGCLFHKVKFVIFITLESHDKTCSKIEKTWFLLAEYNLEFQVSILNHYFFVKYDNRQHPTTRCWFNLDYSLISSLGGKKQLSGWNKSGSIHPEVFCQKGFLNILQNLQESTCTGVFFYYSSRSQLFSCQFCEMFKNAYFVKQKWMTAL